MAELTELRSRLGEGIEKEWMCVFMFCASCIPMGIPSPRPFRPSGNPLAPSFFFRPASLDMDAIISSMHTRLELVHAQGAAGMDSAQGFKDQASAIVAEISSLRRVSPEEAILATKAVASSTFPMEQKESDFFIVTPRPPTKKIKAHCAEVEARSAGVGCWRVGGRRG